MRTQELSAFIKERHAIYLRRQVGASKPWTQDPILQSYRFCNVYRELDTVTQWIAANWREPNRSDPDVWFAMAVARHVNWPPTLEELGYVVPWKPSYFVKRLGLLAALGHKVFSGAYMINAVGGAKGESKAHYLAEQVLGPMWRTRHDNPGLVFRKQCSLEGFHDWLVQFRGISDFMAGQVIADTKYTDLLKDAPDWWTWAAPGPGSARGLNVALGREVTARWKNGEWLTKLLELKSEIDPLVKKAGMPPLHAQDLQSCLCEYAKYTRGYSRSRYLGI